MKQNYFVSQSGIYFEDKWSWHEIDREEKKFYELQQGSSWSEPVSESKFSSVFFRASLKRNIYSSDPYKFLNMLGDIGGYSELLAIVGVALTS